MTLVTRGLGDRTLVTRGLGSSVYVPPIGGVIDTTNELVGSLATSAVALPLTVSDEALQALISDETFGTLVTGLARPMVFLDASAVFSVAISDERVEQSQTSDGTPGLTISDDPTGTMGIDDSGAFE